MARPLRIEFNGALYHVTSGGNTRQAIFLNGEDFANLLEILNPVVKKLEITEYLSIHYSAVSRRVKRIEEKDDWWSDL